MDNESNDKKIAIFYLKWVICIADKTNLTANAWSENGEAAPRICPSDRRERVKRLVSPDAMQRVSLLFPEQVFLSL